MPPSVRLTSTARDHGKALISAGTDRLTGVVRSHKKSLLYVGAALALAGAGSASAATVAGNSAAPLANAPVSASVSTAGAAHASPLSPAVLHTASPAALPGQHAVAPFGRPLATPHAVVRRAAKAPVTAHAVAAKRDRPARAEVRHAAARSAARHAAKPAARTRPASKPHRHAGKNRAEVAARIRHAHRARRARPYLIYDSVTPGAIPAHHLVATYATGGYAVPASQVVGRQVLWIDTNGSDPHASALDIEPGDATPVMAANWVRAKLSADPHALARLYTMQSEWPAVQAAVATLPGHMRSQVRYWIADPTGVPHMVPGASATQWYWGSHYDITTATPHF